MASFDFIDASAKGYEAIWFERSYLFRIAIPVFFVKTACILAIIVLGAETKFLIQGLISLPGNILEAIFIIGLIRFTLYREPIFIWGKAIPMPDGKPLVESHFGWMDRLRSYKAAIILYLLIKVIQLGFSGSMMDMIPGLEETVAQESPTPGLPPLIGGVLMFAFLAMMVWIFRLFFLFIPLAMGVEPLHFLKRISGFQISASMLATWFICFFPLFILFIGAMNILIIPFPQGGASYILIRAVVEGFAETVILSVQSVAMAFGFNEVLSGKKNKE